MKYYLTTILLLISICGIAFADDIACEKYDSTNIKQTTVKIISIETLQNQRKLKQMQLDGVLNEVDRIKEEILDLDNQINGIASAKVGESIAVEAREVK